MTTELNRIFNTDCLEGLRSLPGLCVDMCITSPPYWGLRNYGMGAQHGLEASPEEFVAQLVAVFREVRRVLKDDGTLWLNIGDSYAHNGAAYGNEKSTLSGTKHGEEMGKAKRFVKHGSGLKPKDLIGIPWMLAFALRADGWYLRKDIIWAKKNCMPESVTDRPTSSHEYIFLLSKSPKYYYDHEAIKEPAIYYVNVGDNTARKERQKNENKSIPDSFRNGIRPAGFKDASRNNGKHEKQRGHSKRHAGFNERWNAMNKVEQCAGMRNKRDVWTMPTAQFPEAHFATFPEELPATCIKAGCPPDGIVLDPYMGAGTTALVARKLQRNFIGFELNPQYVAIAEKRLKKELGLFV